jgi:cold shock protein
VTASVPRCKWPGPRLEDPRAISSDRFGVPGGSVYDRKVHDGMPTGTVKWFNDEKGYGFITPDEGGRDLFVHHTGINGQGFRTLQENAKVSYEQEEGDKGPKAVNVDKL